MPSSPIITIILLNKLNIDRNFAMFDDATFAPRTVTCTIHRKERATHICTDFACLQNPIMCGYCLNDNRWRAQHPHQSAIKPINDAVEWLTSVIKNQAKSVQLLYERTIGSRQSELIKFNLEKGNLLTQQLDNRLQNLRLQMQLEMQLMLKEFQRQIQLQKTEFTKKLQEYKRVFQGNLQFIKRECVELLGFQSSLKFYNNFNNFTLKLIHETEKKSQDWLIQQKKILLKVSQALENPAFATNLSTQLGRITKANIFMMPNWKTDKRESQVEKDLHNCLKNALSSWIQLPQLLDLQQNKQEYSSSNKYITYP